MKLAKNLLSKSSGDNPHLPVASRFLNNSNSNSTFIALNLYLMIDSKTQKAKIRDRNR